MGGGAPGAGRRPPSPGRSCTLTVTTEYDDGSPDETYTLVWDGYRIVKREGWTHVA